jgi:hypothetical protein
VAQLSGCTYLPENDMWGLNSERLGKLSGGGRPVWQDKLRDNNTHAHAYPVAQCRLASLNLRRNLPREKGQRARQVIEGGESIWSIPIRFIIPHTDHRVPSVGKR